MRTETFPVNGKEYTLTIESNGFGGKVTVLYGKKVLPITYSVSIEVAQDFCLGDLKGYTGALDHLVMTAKDDLTKGVQR
jgi:hypothetical protein